MKTEKRNENDNTSQTIWDNSNVELPHLTEECLPVIGHSQISSILSTLDPTEKSIPVNIDIPQNLELIVIQNAPIEPLQQADDKLNTNLRTFVCHLCPFFCLDEKRITEHIQIEHKTRKTKELFELKCPACTNIFFHKLSLQAHLTYDHCITDNEDVEKIMQVILGSKVGDSFESKPVEIDIAKTPIIIEGLGETVPSLLKDDEDRIRMIRICPENNEENVVDEVAEASQEELVDDKVESLPQAKEIEISPKSKIEKNLKVKLTKIMTAKLNKCNILNCKVNLKCPDKLSYHKKCHNDKIFTCPECDQTFSSWKYLTGHLWRSHKIDMELYHCDKCDYRTYSLAKLNNIHKLIHGTAKTFECEVCKKCFKNVKQLRNHKDTHKKGDGSCYKCSECNKSFTNRHQMKIHIDGIHRKLKPFLCSYCGYKSATRGALRIHIRQHTGEKPFICDICNYSTADHNSLRRHKLRHSGDKPYKCNHCDYQCIQSSTYKVHVKTKHPGLDKELLFSCPACQFRSISKEVYNSHVTSQHPEMKLD